MGTQEQIQQRINERLTMPANLLEGGFSQDIIGSVSYELANIYDTELNAILDKAFVLTSTGDDLDRVGADYGIARRQDANAIVFLQITGVQGATVNQNVKATYNNLVFTVQEFKKLNSDGVAIVKAQCETAGTIGNVPAETINEFLVQYSGLDTVINLEPAYDGFDKEEDEIYRQRILDYLKEDATNANKAQYEKWAREVTGVQKAVIKSAETMGAGNVGVYISAIESEVSQDLIDAVSEHIKAVQPINATVIVSSLDYIEIDIDATVVLRDGWDTTDVKDELVEKLKVYLPTCDNVVSYFKISELLFECEGVEDVLGYTLNEGNDSIILSDTDYAVVGEVLIGIAG